MPPGVLRPVRALALLVLLALAAGCGEERPTEPAAPAEAAVDFGADPQRLTLEGAPASVQPPAGTWLGRTDRPGPDRWTEQWRRPEDGVLLQAAVFPARPGEHPATALVAVVDAFVRSQGTDGFGQTKRGSGLVRGASAAWTGFAAVLGGVRHEGQARIVQLDADRWALAIGAAPDPAGAAARALVADFAASLLPDEATFYARRFVDPAALETIVARGAGTDADPAVTTRDVAAVQLVIEVASGGRFPLYVQPKLRGALAREASQGSAASRASFRQITATLDETRAMAPAERVAGMRALGKRVLEQIFERAMQGYAPANKYRMAWQGMGRIALADETIPLSVAAMASLGEMAAFLASLAADREVPASESRIKTLRDALQARWAAFEPAGRTALTHAGDDWAALRHAWDHAAPDRRVLFRRAVLEALVTPEQREAIVALPRARDDGGVALLAWMQAHASDGDAYAERALWLARSTRLALVGMLGQEHRPHVAGW